MIKKNVLNKKRKLEIVAQTSDSRLQTSVKGITLVALVITIIILLILAGVAISMITGGDGLFSRADNAATRYNEAAENEAIKLNELLEKLKEYGGEILPGGEEDTVAPSVATLAVVENSITTTGFTLTATGADGESGITEYEFYIKNSAGNFELEKEIESTNTTVTYVVTGKDAGTSYTYKVIVYDGAKNDKESSEITVKTLGDTADDIIANNTETSLYGKYVTNYTPDGVTDVKWRIFHIGKTPNENENNIYLIADHYVPRTDLPAAYGTSKLPNAGNNSYGSRTAYFNNVMSTYSSGTGSIASDNLARNWLSVYWYTLNGAGSAIESMQAVAYMMDTRIWNKFNVTDSAGEVVAKYVLGGPTLELFVESWNKVNKSVKELTITANATGYYINGSNGVDGLTDNTNLWIPGAQYNANATGYTEKEAFGTWVASPSYYLTSDLMWIDIRGGGVYNRMYDSAGRGFRPIVCLKSNILLTTNDNGATYQIVGL